MIHPMKTAPYFYGYRMLPIKVIFFHPDGQGRCVGGQLVAALLLRLDSRTALGLQRCHRQDQRLPGGREVDAGHAQVLQVEPMGSENNQQLRPQPEGWMVGSCRGTGEQNHSEHPASRLLSVSTAGSRR